MWLISHQPNCQKMGAHNQKHRAMMGPVLLFQKWAQILWTGLLKLMDHFRSVARWKVDRAWVYVLRLLIAMVLSLNLQLLNLSTDVLSLTMLALLMWAIMTPHPDQWS